MYNVKDKAKEKERTTAGKAAVVISFIMIYAEATGLNERAINGYTSSEEKPSGATINTLNSKLREMRQKG